MPQLMPRTHMDTLPSPDRTWIRRHWRIVTVVVVIAAVAYFGGIGWIAQRLQRDMAQSMQVAPAVDDNRHRSD